jgi:hypothetical protein
MLFLNGHLHFLPNYTAHLRSRDRESNQVLPGWVNSSLVVLDPRAETKSRKVAVLE